MRKTATVCAILLNEFVQLRAISVDCMCKYKHHCLSCFTVKLLILIQNKLSDFTTSRVKTRRLNEAIQFDFLMD